MYDQGIAVPIVEQNRSTSLFGNEEVEEEQIDSLHREI